MSKEIRILIVEDVAEDAALMNRALRDGDFSFSSKRVETEEEFTQELQQHPPDVILSDHGFPSFDGFSALAIAKETHPEVPFIFVTGAMGEEVAIAAFEKGATDYVLKTRLAHLAPIVQRALREADDRRARKWLEVERDQLIQELKEALTQVKTLPALLRLCSLCKSVHDHQHGWQPLEVYLQKHSDVSLSHELCPECARKISPVMLTRGQPWSGMDAGT